MWDTLALYLYGLTILAFSSDQDLGPNSEHGRVLGRLQDATVIGFE